MQHRKLRLIGYVRDGNTKLSVEEQTRVINQYCHQHGHTIAGFAEDSLRPGLGLQEALQGLDVNDGIIATDLNRFVRHEADRLLDLRPLIENMVREEKVLVTIDEGIETLTANGQKVIFDLLSTWSERESIMMPPSEEHRTATTY